MLRQPVEAMGAFVVWGNTDEATVRALRMRPG
jgi:hypothetical protein